jgi:NhaP-type Na+/H+ or K+/H+ antiporter
VFSAQQFVTTVAVIGGVILITALLSGLIEKSRLPQVAVFLGLGAVLGSAGLGLMHVGLDSPILRVVATLSLVLVLFTDALNLDLKDVRRHAGLAAIVLGPGTLLSAGIVTLGAWCILGLPLPACAILGAALASTDPVLLRGIVRNPSLPAEVRQALRLESGLNDAVLLPIVVIASGFLLAGGPSSGWAETGVRTLLLGPGAGVAVGLAGVAALDLVRRRVGVRRDYESLYSLGIAFLAYAAAESVHGSGFLAAFAAGLTIVALDVELCDCFLEYGETTAEMALLFTFVLLGSSLIWTGFDVLDGRTLLFVILVFAARPAAFLPALALTPLPARSRWMIAWFGPRGLSSLLLVLLPVFAGAPGSERLFATCCLVVLASVAIHGGSFTLLMRRLTVAPVVEAPEPRPVEGGGSIRMSVDELTQLEASGASVVVLDVRTDRSREESGLDAVGAVRLSPDDAVRQAERLGLARDAWLVGFCG